MPTSLSLLKEADPLADCCAPVVRNVMTAGQAEALASLLRAIAEPTRLRLISLVASCRDQEACVCDLTEPVGLSQPTVSHHLKVLVDAGILARQQRGRWAFYRLVPETLDQISHLVAGRSADGAPGAETSPPGPPR